MPINFAFSQNLQLVFCHFSVFQGMSITIFFENFMFTNNPFQTIDSLILADTEIYSVIFWSNLVLCLTYDAISFFPQYILDLTILTEFHVIILLIIFVVFFRQMR